MIRALSLTGAGDVVFVPPTNRNPPLPERVSALTKLPQPRKSDATDAQERDFFISDSLFEAQKARESRLASVGRSRRRNPYSYNPKPPIEIPRPDLDRRKMLLAARADIWDKTDGHCWHCAKKINPFREFCIDHLIPISRGGTDDWENLVPSCKTCNLRKGSR